MEFWKFDFFFWKFWIKKKVFFINFGIFEIFEKFDDDCDDDDYDDDANYNSL